MKGKPFELIEDTELAVTVKLKALIKEDFKNCFGKWPA